MDKISITIYDADNLSIIQPLCEVTRGANKFATVDAFLEYIKLHEWQNSKNANILLLPHTKLKRFTDITYVIAGASRRFLAQLTTHHVGISIMSGSLQYSDWSNTKLKDKFCVPYNILNNEGIKDAYLQQCEEAMTKYDFWRACGIDNDSAGYIVPQGLRNIVIVKVNLEELCYLGRQRLCNRNTDETSYIIGLMCMKAANLMSLPVDMFVPDCFSGKCNEGQYSCGKPLKAIKKLEDYLIQRFPLLTEQILNA